MTTTHICLDCKVDISDRAPNTRRCFDCAEEAQRESKRGAARRRMANPEKRKKHEETSRRAGPGKRLRNAHRLSERLLEYND